MSARTLGDIPSVQETGTTLRYKLQNLWRAVMPRFTEFRQENGNYTPLATQSGGTFLCESATPVTWILTNDLPEGWWIEVHQGGLGQVQFTPGVGSTINAADNLTNTRTQHSVAWAKCLHNKTGNTARFAIYGDRG